MENIHHYKLEKCIDCACCNVVEMKCYPNSEDCHASYNLDKEDLITPARCDFFIPLSVCMS